VTNVTIFEKNIRQNNRVKNIADFYSKTGLCDKNLIVVLVFDKKTTLFFLPKISENRQNSDNIDPEIGFYGLVSSVIFRQRNHNYNFQTKKS
jgi:hypothetical protein